MEDLDMRPKVAIGFVSGQCPVCLRVDFHMEGCPIIPRDREIIHRNQEVKIKVEVIHDYLAELSTLRAENGKMKAALERVISHYSASLDWQPPYVRIARAALTEALTTEEE